MYLRVTQQNYKELHHYFQVNDDKVEGTQHEWFPCKCLPQLQLAITSNLPN